MNDKKLIANTKSPKLIN